MCKKIHFFKVFDTVQIASDTLAFNQINDQKFGLPLFVSL